VPTADARRLWIYVEPVHAITYFSPRARAAFEEANLRGFWRGYFASRAAPLGPVGAAPVIALFFVFAPRMVTRALPDVWSRASPEAAIKARVDGAVAALTDALPPGTSVKEAADLLVEVAAAVDTDGRALAAANAALPVPDGDLARLWHAATVLREHRGDGHMASLLTAGVTGCEALRWRAARDGRADDRSGDLQAARGWTDEEWATAGSRLESLGWLDSAGELTPTGRERHASLEEQTDRLAAKPWTVLADRHQERLIELLRPVSRAISDVIPYPNPVGIPKPD
jgi:hypothetical protein